MENYGKLKQNENSTKIEHVKSREYMQGLKLNNILE